MILHKLAKYKLYKSMVFLLILDSKFLCNEKSLKNEDDSNTVQGVSM